MELLTDITTVTALAKLIGEVQKYVSTSLDNSYIFKGMKLPQT